MLTITFQSVFCQSKEKELEVEPPIISCGRDIELIGPMPIFGECLGDSNIDDCSGKNIRVIILREAKRMNIESQKDKLTAYIKFYVENDGSVQEASVAKSCGDITLDNAAVNIIMKLQDWQPVEYRGVPKRTILVLPVNFN